MCVQTCMCMFDTSCTFPFAPLMADVRSISEYSEFHHIYIKMRKVCLCNQYAWHVNAIVIMQKCFLKFGNIIHTEHQEQCDHQNT